MPTTLAIKSDSSNLGFLRAFLAGVVFMLISAALLIAGFLAWHYPQLLAGSHITPSTITLTDNDLYFAIGKGDTLTLKELIEDGTAVISSKRTRFNASNYPILEYKISGRNPGTDVVLYWRTVSHNNQTLFAKLHWNGDHLAAYNMQNHPEWKGAITELGISVAGDLRKQPISIEQLSFHPITAQSLLLTVWTEWNAFEGWSQKSINVIRGMPESALLSPVVAAAAWCGLAMLLYSLWLFFYRSPRIRFQLEVDQAHQPRSTNSIQQPLPSPLAITRMVWDFKAIVIMFMIAWFALDGKWQVNLWRQLVDTKYLFAGKSHHEQHLAAADAEIYAYAKQLLNVIPERISGRLIILNRAWRDYAKLKLVYYLLPLNIYPYGDWVNTKIFRPNDLLLILSPMKGLFNGNTKGTLTNKLSAQLLHKSKHGNLYILIRTEQE